MTDGYSRLLTNSTVVFLSRSSGVAETYSGFIAELQALGCKAIMVQGSVFNESDVEKSMLAATKPLAGILQASMVLHVSLFACQECLSLLMYHDRILLSPR